MTNGNFLSSVKWLENRPSIVSTREAGCQKSCSRHVLSLTMTSQALGLQRPRTKYYHCPSPAVQGFFLLPPGKERFYFYRSAFITTNITPNPWNNKKEFQGLAYDLLALYNIDGATPGQQRNSNSALLLFVMRFGQDQEKHVFIFYLLKMCGLPAPPKV